MITAIVATAILTNISVRLGAEIAKGMNIKDRMKAQKAFADKYDIPLGDDQ